MRPRGSRLRGRPKSPRVSWESVRGSAPRSRRSLPGTAGSLGSIPSYHPDTAPLDVRNLPSDWTTGEEGRKEVHRGCLSVCHDLRDVVSDLFMALRP